MPLVDGDRPAEGDFWFRILASSGYIARGRVHHSAFKGALSAAQPGRDWDAEASGRLRSLTGSKQETYEHAKQFCKTYNNSFHGYMIPDPVKPTIEGVIVHNIKLGVRFTPIDGVDNAHADLTFTGNIPADKSDEQKKLFLALPDLFIAINDNGWGILPNATITPAAPSTSAPPTSTLSRAAPHQPPKLLETFFTHVGRFLNSIFPRD